MKVLLESEEQMSESQREGKGRGKRQRPAGPPASSPAVVADQTGRLLAEREGEWLERLTTDPASFAVVELEVHEQARRQADLYVAGLLAKASEQAETAPHIDKALLPSGRGKEARSLRFPLDFAISAREDGTAGNRREGRRRQWADRQGDRLTGALLY